MFFWNWINYDTYIVLQNETDSSILRASLMDVILLILGAACQQGSPVELKGT